MGVAQSNPVSDNEEYIGTARAGIEGRASTEIHGLAPAPDLLGGVARGMTATSIEADAHLQSTAWARSQEARLQNGLATQSAPDFSGHNYVRYTASQLYDMVTTNIDPGAVGAAGADWNNLGNTYARIAQDLGSAAGASESGWAGAAGDATRTFLAGMARWADTTAQGAQLAGNQLGMQAEAAQTAMHSIPRPVEPPTAADVRQLMLRSMANPAAGAARLDQQFQAAQQAHAEAVRVVQAYDANLAAAGNTMPAFDTPPAFDPAAGNGNGAASGASGPGTQHISHAQGPRPEVGASQSPVLAVSASQTAQPTPISPSGTTGLSGPSAEPSPTMTTQSAQISPNSSPVDSTTPAPGGTNLPGGQVGGPSLLESPNVPGEPASNLPGESSPNVLGEPLTGGRPIGALEDSGVRTVGATSAGESTPGFVGGRGGRGAADEEHKRPSYLEGPDPDETFGTDQIVAPPVIGA
jgi:hypothetical protein